MKTSSLLALFLALFQILGLVCADTSSAGGKRNGSTCHVSQSCASKMCLRQNPSDKFGICCSPQDCASVGAQCGEIDNGCGTPIPCGLCGNGECIDNQCVFVTTTTSSTTTSTTTSTTLAGPASTTTSTTLAGPTSTTTTSSITLVTIEPPVCEEPVDGAGNNANEGCPCLNTFDCCAVCVNFICTGDRRPPGAGDPGADDSCPF